MTKILVVTQHFWPESFRINDICEGFVEQGYEVDVLCGIPNYPKGEFFEGYSWVKNRRQVINGMKIRRCLEIKRGNNSNIRIFLNYISFPIGSLFSLPYLMRQKYDKIFLFQTSPVMMSLTGILLGKIKKIETTMYVLDLWPENLYSVLKIKSKFLQKFLSWVSNWHYKNADKLIANSKKLQAILQERTGKQNVAFIPQFCEKIYETVVVDESLVIRFSNTFNMVFTGNISPAQSFETVVSAAKIIKDMGVNNIAWIIVGDGMSRSWLEDEVKKAGLENSFTFTGHLPIADIPKYTHIADGLFACLSKSDMLDCALPAKVFSYYATGRPMVLAMDGEIQEIVNLSEAGYAVDAEDYKGFAEAVLRLYNASDVDYLRMREKAKAYYNSHFERNFNMNKLVKILKCKI